MKTIIASLEAFQVVFILVSILHLGNHEEAGKCSSVPILFITMFTHMFSIFGLLLDGYEDASWCWVTQWPLVFMCVTCFGFVMVDDCGSLLVWIAGVTSGVFASGLCTVIVHMRKHSQYEELP